MNEETRVAGQSLGSVTAIYCKLDEKTARVRGPFGLFLEPKCLGHLESSYRVQRKTRVGHLESSYRVQRKTRVGHLLIIQ